MFRKLTENDWALYRNYVDAFYHTDAVECPVPEENYRIAFEEIINSDKYLSCYIFVCDGVECGFCLISKSFSQEAGGLSITFEEIYVEPEYRNRGLATEFFEYAKSHYNAARYRIEVEDSNSGAKRLYERTGFEVLPYIQMVIDKSRKKKL